MQNSFRKYRLIKFTLVCAVILSLSLFNGCIPQKETVYMQDLSKEKDYNNPYGELDGITNKYKLMPNDQLYVNVYTSNPKLSEYFNPGRNSNSNVNTQNISLFAYVIDDEMNIDFPFVGKINLSGCNKIEAKERISEALKPFLTDAQITVRLYNSTFLALGEFGRVGRIDMGKEQITIFEAVALAGDIKAIGKKKKVQIMRPTPEGAKIYTVDLTDRNIINSEQYYVYNNDVLYVRPMKARHFGIGETFSFGVVGTVLAFTLSVFAFSRAFK